MVFGVELCPRSCVELSRLPPNVPKGNETALEPLASHTFGRIIHVYRNTVEKEY